MIVAIDTETYKLDKETRAYEPVLDPEEFKIACIIREDRKTPKFITDREDVMPYLMKLAREQGKYNKNLYVYAHNHKYDFSAYGAYRNTGIRYYCLEPFIAELDLMPKSQGGKIKFLDTMALFPMALDDVGKALGYLKGTLPRNIPPVLFDSMIRPYLLRDTEIVYKAVMELRKLARDAGVTSRELISMGQMSVNYFMNQLRKKKYAKDYMVLFSKQLEKPMAELVKPQTKRCADLIHEAYRLGRVEPFALGRFEDTRQIDINNMFTWAACNTTLPNLHSEKHLTKPISYHGFDIDRLLAMHGVSTAVAQLPDKRLDVGYLPVRYKDQTAYPTKPNTYLLGTWTHLELRRAKELGYKILDVLESVIYTQESQHNPFTDIIKPLNTIRQRYDKNSLGNLFYKGLQNNLWGKLAQRREESVSIVCEMSREAEYERKGFALIDREGTISYMRKALPMRPKRFYAPYLAALVTAKARDRLYDELVRVPRHKLLYCDTDSITYICYNSEMFKYGKDLGEFKVVCDGQTTVVKGKKAYRVGNNVKLSGIPRRYRNATNFDAGTIQYARTHQRTPIAKMAHREHQYQLDDTQRRTTETALLLEQETFIVDDLLNDDADLLAAVATVRSDN